MAKAKVYDFNDFNLNKKRSVNRLKNISSKLDTFYNSKEFSATFENAYATNDSKLIKYLIDTANAVNREFKGNITNSRNLKTMMTRYNNKIINRQKAVARGYKIDGWTKKQDKAFNDLVREMFATFKNKSRYYDSAQIVTIARIVEKHDDTNLKKALADVKKEMIALGLSARDNKTYNLVMEVMKAYGYK